jgi:hypothetical protein
VAKNHGGNFGKPTKIVTMYKKRGLAPAFLFPQQTEIPNKNSIIKYIF